jgi:hypothetical protein
MLRKKCWIAGQSLAVAVFVLALGCLSQPGTAQAEMSIRRTNETVEVLAGGKPVTTLHFGQNWDKPFLHPLRSSSGTVVSRGFPLNPAEGETTDHAWHRGIWYGHGDVSGEDFWREPGAQKSGKLAVTQTPVASVANGAAILELSMKMQGREPEKKAYGTIAQRYAIRVDGPIVWIDAVVTIKADAGIDLKFADTDDGGLGFRLSDAYREDRGARLINSEGGSGSGAIWGKSARWVDYSAAVAGKTIGLAAFDHPANVRYPGGWHARGYALCAANPFALGSFAKDKSVDGSYTVKAGGSLTLRYRLAIHEGEASTEQLNEWHAAWAKTPAM